MQLIPILVLALLILSSCQSKPSKSAEVESAEYEEDYDDASYLDEEQEEDNILTNFIKNPLENSEKVDRQLREHMERMNEALGE